MPRATTSAPTGPIIVKFGGELLEAPRRLRRIARTLATAARRRPLVVVHGGGREVDAEMARRGLTKRAVDGLRLTDADTLDVVLGVLAGQVNTRLVAAIVAAGGRAVGLTGADAGMTRVTRARRYRATDGSLVDLGFVGVPETTGTPTLVRDLIASPRRYIPVIASIGSDAKGQLYNINADTLAGSLAARLGARALVIAGTTAGVLDDARRTIPAVDDACLAQLVESGGASAGMIAKLLACRTAGASGVRRVSIVDGRRQAWLDQASSVGRTLVTAGRDQP